MKFLKAQQVYKEWPFPEQLKMNPQVATKR